MKYIYVHLFLLWIPIVLFANIRFKSITIDNGLAHTDVHVIVQDSCGLIWMGTNNGLQVYDGYDLKRYDYYNSSQRVYQYHNRIRNMIATRTHLWLGTESGLACFDLEKRSFVPIKTKGMDLSLLAGTEYQFTFDSENNRLWILIENRLVVANIQGSCLHKLEWENSEEASTFALNLYLLRGNGESVWGMAGDGKILRLAVEGDKVRVIWSYLMSELLGHRLATDLLVKGSHLYFRTNIQCIRYDVDEGGDIDRQSKKVFDFGLAEYYFTDISNKLAVDENENLYYLSSKGIMMVQEPFSAHPQARLLFPAPKQSLVYEVKHLFIDRFHNLWIAMQNWGVHYCSLDESSFRTIDICDLHVPGITQGDIAGVTSGSEKTIWILTGGGMLLQYDTERHQTILIEMGLQKYFSYFQSINMSSNGRLLYIGTANGLIVYDIANRISRLCLSQYSFTSVNEMVDGYLWAGTWGLGLVLFRFVGEEPKVLCELNRSSRLKLPSDRVTDLKQLGEEKLLCCTDNGMAIVALGKDRQPVNVSLYQADESLPRPMSSNYIATAAVENDSVYWLGTIGGGVCRVTVHSPLDNAYESQNYTMKNYLPSNDVEMVFLDKEKNVWLGGHGITKMSRDGKGIVLYDVSDGLQSNSFKIGSGCQAADGTIYMGGLYGLNYFAADKVKLSLSKANMIITDVKIYNQNHKQTDEAYCFSVERNVSHLSSLELTEKETDFYIYFSALDYVYSDKILYRYRMVDLHNDWVMLPRGQNYAPFIDTPPGKFRFEVQMSADNGVSWENTRYLDLMIRPAWWQTGWAKYSFAFLILAVLVTWLYSYIYSLQLQKENVMQKLKQQHVEEIYQSKMRFFINISHELKTPLALIRLATEHIHSSSPSVDSTCVLQNVNYLNTLISELTEIRKNELGIQHLSCVSQDINSLVKEVMEEIRPWAESKSIYIEAAISNEPLIMEFDRVQVIKLILNLLSNAIKYTENGKRIECISEKGTPCSVIPYYKTSYVEGETQGQPWVWILKVRDEGIGISSESISSIYNRFFQVNDANLQHLGSGIGLAIVKNIVLLHHGTIIVSSERLRGTEFIVMLPLHQTAETLQVSPPALNINEFIKQQYTEFKFPVSAVQESTIDSSNEGLPLILIVEDNVELLQLLIRDLKDDFQVETAVNGKLALEKCYTIYPELIISDVMMPEMNGIEFCKAIRDNFTLAYVPFIMLTAKNEEETQVESYESGADLYLSKPFSMQVLKVAIRRLLQHSKMLSQVCVSDVQEKVRVKLAVPVEFQKTRKEEEEREAQEFFIRAKELVEQNLSNPDLGGDFLADSLGVSRSKMYQILKKVTDISLSDYIRNLRLEKAAYLLRFSTKNIAEIMLETGFVNQSHFTRTFKQKYDVPPKVYQNSQGGKSGNTLAPPEKDLDC